MRVVITGSTGFLGSHIVDYFARDGFECIATDRPGSDFSVNERAGAIIKPLDLIKEDPTPLLENTDVVVHVAGVFDLKAPKELLWAVNVEGARKMADAALNVGVKKFIHISSTGVYGKPARIPCHEEDRKKPRNNYELTKWEGAKAVVEYYEKKGLPVVVFRPTLIYGPRSRYGHAMAIGALALIKALGRKLDYMLNGGPMEHSVHVEDVARAALYAAKNDSMVGNAYNVADETPVPLGEMMKAIMDALGVEARKSIKYIPFLWKIMVTLVLMLPSALERRLNRDLEKLWRKVMKKLDMESPFIPRIDKGWLKYVGVSNVYSNEKLKKTGFEFKFPDYRKGMEETIRWYINHGWIPDRIIPREKPSKGQAQIKEEQKNA